jgi:hypothetical protein
MAWRAALPTHSMIGAITHDKVQQNVLHSN